MHQHYAVHYQKFQFEVARFQVSIVSCLYYPLSILQYITKSYIIYHKILHVFFFIFKEKGKYANFNHNTNKLYSLIYVIYVNFNPTTRNGYKNIFHLSHCLPLDSPCQRHVFGKNCDTFGMYCTLIHVFQQLNKVGPGDLMKGQYSTCLDPVPCGFPLQYFSFDP